MYSFMITFLDFYLLFNLFDRIMNEDDSDLIFVPPSPKALFNPLVKRNSNEHLLNSKTITKLLKTESYKYIVVKSESKKSSDIWLKFGFPARRREEHSDLEDKNSDISDENLEEHENSNKDENLHKDKNLNKYDIIPNFTSCFKCFQTYRFTDATTSSMRDHKCPEEKLNRQRGLNEFMTPSLASQSPSSHSVIVSKRIKEKKQVIKRLFVRWIVTIGLMQKYPPISFLFYVSSFY